MNIGNIRGVSKITQDGTIKLDPITSEYYTEQTVMPSQNYYGGNNFMGNNSGYMGMGGYQQANGGQYGMSNIGRNNNRMMPRTIRTNTGDISMVNKMIQNRQPYQYNVPSIAEMFPQLAIPMNQQYTGGVGQFMGGLLGNSPMLSQANAPASSGAGRFA
jgi:hypothetical protein